MTINFDMPLVKDVMFHSPSIDLVHRGIEVSLSVTIEIPDEDDGYCPSLHCLVSNKRVNIHDLMDEVADIDAMMDFCNHVRGDTPLSEQWYAAFERAIDLFIDRHQISPSSKQNNVMKAATSSIGDSLPIDEHLSDRQSRIRPLLASFAQYNRSMDERAIEELETTVVNSTEMRDLLTWHHENGNLERMERLDMSATLKEAVANFLRQPPPHE